jgi:cell division protein WhiA
MADEVSYNSEVKEELARIWATQECCRQSEVAALLRACGTIELGSGRRLSCFLTTDHSSVARKMLRLIKSCFRLQTEVMVKRRLRLRKNLAYLVRIPHQDGLRSVLQQVGVLDQDGLFRETLNLADLSHDGCLRAYLRGLFLGSGWVNAPDREHHLEVTAGNPENADLIGQILFGYSIRVRMSARKERLVLYLKDGDQVGRMLALLGAHQAMLKYEDVRALKEMKNRVNRQVNAETANMSKTVDAAARQVDALLRVQASGGLERLSPPLQELARLRIAHPEVSLRELGEMCNPPVTKSGINHRMRALMKLAGAE